VYRPFYCCQWTLLLLEHLHRKPTKLLLTISYCCEPKEE
jgi:hypothetical protein